MLLIVPIILLSLIAHDVFAGTVSMLTYNFYQRPLVKENYSDFKGARRRKFCKLIKQATGEANGFVAPDIIAFEELFGDMYKHHIITCAREAGYNYYVIGPGRKMHRLKFYDSGLLLLSKYPIVAADTMVYKAGSSVDWLASKGTIYAKIQLGDTEFINVFTTHTQASYGSTHPSDKSVRTRRSQFSELKRFMVRTVGSQPDYPTFLMGDFNVNAQQATDEYRTVMGILNSLDGPKKWQDVFHTLNNEHPVTFGTSSETVLTSRTSVGTKQTLDYIMFLQGKKTEAIQVNPNTMEVRVEEFKCVESCHYRDPKQDKGLSQLSDHFGLLLTMTVPSIDERLKLAQPGQINQLRQLRSPIPEEHHVSSYKPSFSTLAMHHAYNLGYQAKRQYRKLRHPRRTENEQRLQ